MSVADLWEALKKKLTSPRHTPLSRYGLAVLAVAIATLLEFGLYAIGPFHQSFILFYPTVVLVAMRAGFGPGILATVLSAISAGYFFVEPRYTFTVRTSEDVLGPALFAFIGVFLTVLTFSRSKARQALLVSDAELSRAQAVAHIGSWHYDIEHGNMRLSDEACRILGFSPQASISLQQARDLVHPEDRTRVDNGWKTSLKTGVYDDEIRIIVDGRTRWARILASLERVRAGQTLKAVGTVQDITAAKLVRERNEEFERVVEGLDEMIAVVNREYRYVIANPAFLKHRGAKKEDVVGKTIEKVVNPESLELVKRKVDECLRGEFVQYEMRYRYPTLGERDLLVSYFPILDSSGIVDRVACILRDLTEQRHAEEQLQRSEDRYRDLVEHSEDLLCTHDLQGRLLTVNPAPARILGYEVEELLKIPMRDLIVPEGRVLFEEYLERLRTTGQPEHGLLCVMTKSGEVRTWEYDNTLRTEGVEKPVVRGMAHDVTEQRRAELALGSSEQRYRMLFEKNVAAVAICNTNGDVFECNDAWARVLGYETAAEIRGRNTSQFYMHPKDRQPLLAELNEKGSFSGHEVQLRRKDGSTVWVVLDCALVTPEQELPLVQATAIDVTARKQAEEELQKNEERFRVALKESPVTVFNQDRALRYTWIYNPRLFLQDSAVGKTDEEILGAKRATRLNELKRQVLDTGKALREEVVISQGTKPYSFELTIEPLFDAAKNIIGITGSSMDIARLRELADNLRDAKERLAQEKSYLENEIEAELGFEEIIGQSPALRDVLKNARVVAPIDSTVLLLGESGTGKELVARAIHALSSRHERSFIKLNCAAVPSGLLESELFGHERGAFTGAVNQKIGRVELADKGTLFLDEIGELPLELQPKLLRLLQDREFERLGGVHTLRVDVRIISATNRELQKDVADRKFREDLFYRLNVFPIELPPLRERRDDIPALVHHFVRKHAARMGKHIEIIPGETVRILQNWNWPGNIRELENMIERMVILSKGPVLAATSDDLTTPEEFAEDSLSEMEREHIVRILRETNGMLGGAEGAANRLGIKRTTLQSMLKRFGIEPRDFRRGTGTFGSE